MIKDMKSYKKRRLIVISMLLILSIVCIKSCVVSDKNKDKDDKNTSSVVSGPQKPENIGTPLPQVSETVTTIEEPVFSEKSELNYLEASFSPEDISSVNTEYLKDMVIVGDSVSMGYSVYGRLDANNVLATGSIGARNVMETQFSYQGYSLFLLDILERRKPKYIFMSLGLNDMNLMDEEKYTSLCEDNAEKIHEVTPDSKIIFTAITPISAGNTFADNDKIDRYNEALRKKVYEIGSDKIFFVNAAQYLKNSNNCLESSFSSGDGIHLAATAYDYLLSYMLLMLEWI